MSFNLTIRHTEHVEQGAGAIHSYFADTREGASEDAVLRDMRFAGIWDGVAAITASRPEEGMPYSVDTGHLESPSDGRMPDWEHDLRGPSDFEGRLG